MGEAAVEEAAEVVGLVVAEEEEEVLTEEAEDSTEEAAAEEVLVAAEVAEASIEVVEVLEVDVAVDSLLVIIRQCKFIKS